VTEKHPWGIVYHLRISSPLTLSRYSSNLYSAQTTNSSGT
jgi:hypothetical protein